MPIRSVPEESILSQKLISAFGAQIQSHWAGSFETILNRWNILEALPRSASSRSCGFQSDAQESDHTCRVSKPPRRNHKLRSSLVADEMLRASLDHRFLEIQGE